MSKRLKLKRVLTPTDEPRSNKRSKLLVEEGEVQLVGPEQTSGPIGELESSYSPQVSHQPLPSFSSRIEITATSCHLFDPETSQGCTVSLPMRHLRPLSRQFTQVTVSSVKEPPCEDTEEEHKERTYRSALSAVNLEQINHMFPMVGMLTLENRTPILTRICLSRRTSGNHHDSLNRPHGCIRPPLRSYSWRFLGLYLFFYHGLTNP